MTMQAIIDALCDSDKGITRDRVVKAEARATRQKLRWAHVLAAMTEAQRAAVLGVL